MVGVTVEGKSVAEGGAKAGGATPQPLKRAGARWVCGGGGGGNGVYALARVCAWTVVVGCGGWDGGEGMVEPERGDHTDGVCTW